MMELGPRFIILSIVLLGMYCPGIVQGTPQRDIFGHVGETILLPCVVDTTNCGDLHSIKWYRGQSRIFVFSDKAKPKISRAEGEYVDRLDLRYTANSSEAQLVLSKLNVTDEGMYKCDLTYLAVGEGCPVVQYINLTALIKPQYIRLLDASGAELKNVSQIGPYSEGDELTLTCESGGGKPTPSVVWINKTNVATTKMNGVYVSEVDKGVGTGRSTVKVTLGRGDLRARFVCQASNQAITSPMEAYVNVSLHVRPLHLELSGVKEHVVQGTNVAAECTVTGAKPPAEIAWYNGSTLLTPHNAATHADAEDGTTTTQSLLIFTATLYENGQTLSCEATNPVLQQLGEKPIRQDITLEVLYPPIVTVGPENITVNESTDISLSCSYVANPTTLKQVNWYRNGQRIFLNPDRHEGGTTEETSLLIKNSSRFDQGTYDCELINSVGGGNSTNSVFVAVYFKPIVKLVMEPETPVSEVKHLNITLMCQVESGNPDVLQAVRWYLDGEVLKELPDCDNSTELFCDIDPSRLLLEDVGRGFHANYSCEGMNDAGWGPISDQQELIVYYPPGAATLTYEPSRVIKKGSVTLTCSVDDLGRPQTTTYVWLRGSHLVPDITTANWTIDPVSLETQSNFTCFAKNAGGEGESATVYIEVFAPPAFIKRPEPYSGALFSSQNVNISCRVECSPICDVNWLKNDVPLDPSNGSLYIVNNTKLPPSAHTNDFESILSILQFNMAAWPGGQLDSPRDNARYSCQSTSNLVGPGVNSTTSFGVEYPPEQIKVSNEMVNVTEGHIPEKVICHANAQPDATYVWKKQDEKETLMKGKFLILNYPLDRRNSGDYYCIASNKHGHKSIKTTINVLYRPECGIIQTEMDGKLILTCTANANPSEVDFVWKIKNDNETLSENIESNAQQSTLTLESYIENFRTYICIANNSIGAGAQCERDVTGHAINWWGKFENDHMLIIIAVIVGAILVVIIICTIIIIVCRRKRADDKYNNPVELEERENPEGDASLSPARPTHKWPLRPGVLVHINGSHSLSLSQLPHDASLSNSNHTNTAKFTITPERKGRIKTAARKLKQRRATSLNSLGNDDLNQHSRTNKIKQMFLNEGTRYRCDTLPGVFHGKSGVVTFKKLDGPSTQGVSRKRKKPGSDLSPSTTKDKRGTPSDGLLHPDGDKAFYENLPFHGMQTAPNKLFASDCNSQQTNRPPSQLSQYGSSGYGSTRSRVQPHLQKPLHKPVHKYKFNSLKMQSRKCRADIAANLRHFYSMRVSKTDKNTYLRDESSALKSETEIQLKDLSKPVNSLDDTHRNDSTNSIQRIRLSPPVPAPRKHVNSKAIKHTYQNVPIPISPNSQEVTPPKEGPKPSITYIY